MHSEGSKMQIAIKNYHTMDSGTTQKCPYNAYVIEKINYI